MKLTYCNFGKSEKLKEESKIVCNPNHLDLWHFNVWQDKFLFILLFFCLPSLIYLFFQINLNLKSFWVFPPPQSITEIFIELPLDLRIQEAWHFIIMCFLIEEHIFFHIGLTYSLLKIIYSYFIFVARKTIFFIYITNYCRYIGKKDVDFWILIFS